MAGNYAVCVSYGVSSAVVELSVSLVFLDQSHFSKDLLNLEHREEVRDCDITTCSDIALENDAII